MPTTPVRLARRTHAERSQQTRQHLIATTIQIVQDRGLEAESILEVAKTAGMTPGAVQHHFASKADLMMQVLAQIVADQDASGALWPSPQLPLPERAHAFVHGLWLLIYGQPRFIAAWSIYLGSRSQPEVVQRVAAQRQVLGVKMYQGFCQSFPELPPVPETEAFVDLVLSALRGMGVRQLFSPDNTPPAAQLQALARTVVLTCTASSVQPSDTP